MSNQAAWLPSEKATLKVDNAEMYEPTADQLLVKNAVIALNPIDAKIQKFAIFPLRYPSILGISFAGVVERVGSSVTTFEVGDRVVVEKSAALNTSQYSTAASAYQKYAIADPRTTSKIEDGTSFVDAAATITNLATSVSALSIFAKLDRPSAQPNAGNRDKKVLVYGGSSSVGAFAIQYAAQAGYTVITTSSPRNHSFVSTLGAAEIVDHTKPTHTLVAELKKRIPYHTVFDTISEPSGATMSLLGKVLEAQGGGKIWITSPAMGPLELPKRVETEMHSYPYDMETPETDEMRKWFYEEYFPKGLASGKIIPTRTESVAGGLQVLQGALDRIMSVSGTKLVVEV